MPKKKAYAVEVTLPGGEVFGLRAPGVDEWDRYVAKRSAGEVKPGRRELVACCAVSHEPDAAMALVRRWPGVVVPIADALDDAAGGSVPVVVDVPGGMATATLPDGSELVVRAPDCDEWESLEGSAKSPVEFGPVLRGLLSQLVTDGPKHMLEALPAMSAGPLFDAVAELAGAGFEVAVKKA